MTDKALPAAGKDGVRTFQGQMTLDTKGTALFKEWFETVFQTACRATNKVVQLRGVDLAVNLRGRSSSAGPVGTDLKIDTYESKNISFELISQCRGHAKRNGPALGWITKDMPWVTYYFIKTGEVVFLDMAQVYPWLEDLIVRALAGHRPGFPDEFDYWVSATPNQTYQSYNIMMRIIDVLMHCPGAYYHRLTDSLPAETIKRHTGADLQPFLVKQPPADRHITPEQLHELMKASGCYHLKPQLTEDETERLIRWCETYARYSTKPGVGEKGRALQATRPRRWLEGDPVDAGQEAAAA